MKLSTTKDRRLLSDINVTPFVDVMLVLLIIFMITAPMLQQGIEVSLPKTDSPSLLSKEERIVLTIKANEDIYINEIKIRLSRLRETLEKIFRNRSKKEIFLKADRAVPYGFVVRTMSEIKKAGINDLGMITEPEEKGK